MKKFKNSILFAVPLFSILLWSFVWQLPIDDVTYQKEIKEWQAKRDSDLKSASSPLNLIGIYFLKEGVNTFGSAENNDLVLPKGKIAEYAGQYVLKNDTISLQLKEGAGIVYKGITVLIKSDLPSPDDTKAIHKDTTIQIQHGTLKWFLFISGGRIAARVLDSQSENQVHFKGVERYPVDKKWRVEAKFQPYEQGKKIEITTVKGKSNLRAAAGLVVFTVGGKEYKLEALDRGPNLFFVFSDQTSMNDGTYAFRFLTVKKPGADNIVVVDFNKATNPNCAFSEHAPCPLPPAQNKLTIAIPAGEKKYTIAHN